MALSNKFGWLVLTTGNKSEMSVGYTTLYGDLAGGFAVIKDVPKTLVYRLCEWRNSPRPGATIRRRARSGPRRRASGRRSPPSIIERAPSAELRPDQRDEDSLPPYELLDRILQGYIELDQQPRAADRRRGCPRPTSTARSGSSTSPSTSAARRPRASRSPRARSAATGACRSPTATAADAGARRSLMRSTCVRRSTLGCAARCARRAAAATRCRTSRSRTTSSRRWSCRPASRSTGSAAPSTGLAITEARTTRAAPTASSTATALQAARARA